MRALCCWTGALVLLLVLASSGLMAGRMCAGSIGCIQATNGGLTLRAAP